MKLIVYRRYSNGRDAYDAGQVIDVDADKARWLMRDSPGTFEECQEPVPEKVIAAPPADKMVRAATTKAPDKSRRRR